MKELKPGFYNSGQNGQSKGYDSYVCRYQKRLWGLLQPKAIIKVELAEKPEERLFYVAEDGTWYQPNRSYESDWGSIPPALQPIIPKDRYLGFLFHDSGYMEEGLWVSNDKGATWTFKRMSQKEVDALLKEMVKHDPAPGPAWHKRIIYRMVRLFGGGSFGKGDLKNKKEK